MDRGVLRALSVVKRPLVLGVLLASACTLNPQGEDPGVTNATGGGSTSFLPGMDVSNSDGTVTTINEDGNMITTPPGGVVTPGAMAGPGGTIGGQDPTGGATGATGSGVTPPLSTGAPDPSPVGAGGAGPSPATSAGGASSGGAAGAESETGTDFDGGTFNYSNDQDAGPADAGAPDDAGEGL